MSTNRNAKTRLATTLSALLLSASVATAQTDRPGQLFGNAELSLEDNFRSGQFEGTLAAGPMFSPVGVEKNRPTINYAVGGAQLGYMVTQPGGDGFFRGNFELALEGFGSEIFDGPGNYIAGGTLWFRYNFIPRSSRLIPYVQLGGGALLTDTDRQLVGQAFNFNLDASAGVRCFLTRHWTVNLEYRFQHISNADTGPRNVGINAQGPFAGVSWFF